MNELAKGLCEAEGGKKQVNIAQVKEILKLISIAIVNEPGVLLLLLKNGTRLTDK